jgi:hypothetical protein
VARSVGRGQDPAESSGRCSLPGRGRTPPESLPGRGWIQRRCAVREPRADQDADLLRRERRGSDGPIRSPSAPGPLRVLEAARSTGLRRLHVAGEDGAVADARPSPRMGACEETSRRARDGGCGIDRRGRGRQEARRGSPRLPAWHSLLRAAVVDRAGAVCLGRGLGPRG